MVGHYSYRIWTLWFQNSNTNQKANKHHINICIYKCTAIYKYTKQVCVLSNYWLPGRLFEGCIYDSRVFTRFEYIGVYQTLVISIQLYWYAIVRKYLAKIWSKQIRHIILLEKTHKYRTNIVMDKSNYICPKAYFTLLMAFIFINFLFAWPPNIQGKFKEDYWFINMTMSTIRSVVYHCKKS